jgi:DNA-binding response OmpR family regulator
MHVMAANPEPAQQVLEVGPLIVIPQERLARADGRTLVLSHHELRLLTELARRPDRIVSREQLFSLAWGRELRPGDRSIDVYIRKLRVKLQAALPGWSCIHTHFGFGYRLAPERSRDVFSHVDNTSALPSAKTSIAPQ